MLCITITTRTYTDKQVQGQSEAAMDIAISDQSQIFILVCSLNSIPYTSTKLAPK